MHRGTPEVPLCIPAYSMAQRPLWIGQGRPREREEGGSTAGGQAPDRRPRPRLPNRACHLAIR